MVDFRKLRAARAQPTVTDPLEIFRRLPKPPGINDLYTSQAEVLREWFGRRTERDTVIKLQTGGGKTLVGLLIAQSIMSETHGPVVYVCPTIQLVTQTLEKASAYGIPAVAYDRQQWGSFPDAFLNGTSVLVCVYQALFNGLSRFGTRGGSKEIIRVAGMVLDDAHVAFSAVREAFTLRVTRAEDPTGYATLTTMFRKDFEDIGRVGTYDDLVDEQTGGTTQAPLSDIIEVPYWGWYARLGQVRVVLRELAKDDRHRFVWPFLRDNLNACHCLIGHEAVVIVPLLPLVDLIPTFAECPRRVFMSATISDDSAIVRAFSASAEVVAKPITSTSLAGVSERMILAPELMRLPSINMRAMLGRLVKSIAEQERVGAVILTPSAAAAKEWQDVATFADSTNKVSEFVRALQAGTELGPFVFANRYDGIDLPGSTCRVLILWGLPKGASEYDLFRAAVFADSASLNSELAQRIEQGMGRGARGGSDYCVVILGGEGLTSRLGRTSHQKLLTSSTRAQIEMGLDITKAVIDEQSFMETIMQCLHRSREWIEYHAEVLANLATTDPIDMGQLALASEERAALKLLRHGHYEEAVVRLQKYCQDSQDLDQRTRGWLLQLAARAAYLWGSHDRAQELQRRAFGSNDNLLRPSAEPAYMPIKAPGRQAEAIAAGLAEYKVRRGYLAALDEIAAHLVSTASANQFEEALAELGEMLGFEVDRPDNRISRGPDVLWLLEGDRALVMEAKSRKLPYNPLTKEEHGQLLNAEAWFKTQYPTYQSVRVVVHPNSMATQATPVVGTRALTLARLNSLIADVRQLVQSLADMAVPHDELVLRCERLLASSSLRPQALIATYLADFSHQP